VVATFLLIGIGGLVTSTGSGLSVPDWPLSYGMWLPPMVGGVRFEHGHRMAAGAVGLLTLALAVWTQLREPRRAVRRLTWAALFAVVVQAVLGGLTVLFLLPTAVSVAHACLAQTFFCLLIAVAFSTSREWVEAVPRDDARGLRAASAFLFGAAYLQLVLGAVMRHLDSRSWAASQTLPIPDFPLSLGRAIPPLDSFPVLVHFAHRILALVILGAVLTLAIRAARAGESRLARPALVVLLLVVLQVGLGGLTVLSSRATVPATAHVMTGALILGSAFFVMLRAFRHLGSPRPEGAAVETLGRVPVRP
jgi:cytochrome c oxidase assembly protein subunit 15